MKLSIPLYVETRNDGSERSQRHHVRPLFFPAPTRADEDLGRAQQRLLGDLQQYLLHVGQNLRHEFLAAWTYAPRIEQHRLDLLIDLRRRTARGRFFFVVFESLDRRLCFCPTLPQLWFELRRQQSLPERAATVFSQYFRRLESEAENEADIRPEAYALAGTAWVTAIDLDLDIVQVHRRPEETLWALLGGGNVSDGAAELRNCGRCLNWLYPRGLDRAERRDHQVAELTRRLCSGDHRPVLILGRRQSGKSAIVHEYVARMTAQRSTPYSARRNVWLLSPQRLISGMSYVGQWESRLLAILKEARKRHHILYFDDLPGLLRAGQSRESDLNMAQVIRPFLERREVRVLAEITPEAWRVLRERDRALADLFDVLPVEETDRVETARILLSVRRSLEQEFRCEFALDALPTILEIERRYSPDAAFPGKAIRFLKDLALVHRGRAITRDQVLDEFHRRSGLQSRFLDPRQRLERDEIVTALNSEVVGQAEPVAAVADVLSIAKARVNDTGRPMGSLLFVGPTGVGKTQLARSVARYLFGDPGRLVRFDLNEFITRGSAARLVGSFHSPEGLLTGAIRRQPFAVILFDEIEKAHPEVWDLLLQVLGEGRLSDGQGFPVSFTNTLIIMTSNLGSRENLQKIGFAGDAASGDHVWQAAVERFFRPEFFNRIDRIVPFQRLSRTVIADVARVLLSEILQRDGLSRRRCLLTIEPQALDQVIESGYSQALGARSLKRSLEELLVRPAGRQLAALPPGELSQIHLYPAGNSIAVQVRPLRDAAVRRHCVASARLSNEERARDAVVAFARRVEELLIDHRPDGPVTAGRVSARQHAYYQILERCRRLRSRVALLSEVSEAASRAANRTEVPGGAFRHSRRVHPRRFDSSSIQKQGRHDATTHNYHLELRELFDDADPILDSDLAIRSILYEAALTQRELSSIDQDPARHCGLWILPLDGLNQSAAAALADRLERWLTGATEIDLGLDIRRLPSGIPGILLELEGLGLEAVRASECGLHLDWPAPGDVHAVQVIPVDAPPGDSLDAACRRMLAARQAWQSRRGTADTDDEDPLAPGEVVRIYESWGLTLNLRTGDMTEGLPNAASWQKFMLGSLELPVEFQDANV